jgi:hypothetical protein
MLNRQLYDSTKDFNCTVRLQVSGMITSCQDVFLISMLCASSKDRRVDLLKHIIHLNLGVFFHLGWAASTYLGPFFFNNP